MKKYIVITGGAGFIGSNLIEFLLKKTKYKLIILFFVLNKSNLIKLEPMKPAPPVTIIIFFIWI